MSQPPTPGDERDREAAAERALRDFGQSFLREQLRHAEQVRDGQEAAREQSARTWINRINQWISRHPPQPDSSEQGHLRWRAGLGEQVQHEVDGLLNGPPQRDARPWREQEMIYPNAAMEQQILDVFRIPPSLLRPGEESVHVDQNPEPLRITSTPTPEQIEEMRAGFTAGFRGSVEGEFVTQPTEFVDAEEVEAEDAEFSDPDWNLRMCLYNNPEIGFLIGSVKRTLAVVEGERDERAWHWLLEMLGEGHFVYLIGGCDYSGWDCRSWATKYVGDSPYAAILACQEQVQSTDYENTQQQLLAQLADGLVRTTREKIGASLLKDGAHRHLVVRDRLFSINHMWRCEHCNFLSSNDDEARVHSEVKLAMHPKPGRLRGKRRDL